MKIYISWQGRKKRTIDSKHAKEGVKEGAGNKSYNALTTRTIQMHPDLSVIPLSLDQDSQASIAEQGCLGLVLTHHYWKRAVRRKLYAKSADRLT